MASVIFNGTGVKTLKDELRILTGAYIISRATDPTSVAVSAPIGSLLIHPTTGNIYRKLDSGSSTNWVLLGANGGTQVQWDEMANAPYLQPLNNFACYTFEATLGQELYTEVVVPDWYQTGRQIRLQVLAYITQWSNQTFRLMAQSTLVRSETDLVSSTTNQRTSTNSAITTSSGIENELQKISIDLTDSSGQINSVAVSPQDLIGVRLYRDATDTSTYDVNMIAKSGRILWY